MKKSIPSPEIRTTNILLAQLLRGGNVTPDSLAACNEAADEIAEFVDAWLKAKHGGYPLDETDAAWLVEAAEKLSRRRS